VTLRERDQLTTFFPAPIEDRNAWLRPALMTSDDVEWYTPPEVRDAVVEALGGIVDVDPCADPGLSFPASTHYTKDDNGLTKRWLGRVYMNPPYGREISAWTTKLRDELRDGWCIEAVALLPTRTDARWYQELRPEYVCHIRGRLRFSGYEQSAPFPSSAAYFGPNPRRFMAAFAHLGLLYADASALAV
jgi:hypothetical protein